MYANKVAMHCPTTKELPWKSICNKKGFRLQNIVCVCVYHFPYVLVSMTRLLPRVVFAILVRFVFMAGGDTAGRRIPFRCNGAMNVFLMLK
jgi:hypothetical protein